MFISAVAGGTYLLACGTDGSEFDNGGDKDGGGQGDAPNGGGFPDGSGGNGGDSGGGGDCSRIILATVRDFKPCNNVVRENNAEDMRQCDPAVGHPDFEHYQGDDATTGIVAATLGLPDRKPVYVGDGPHNYPGTTRPETTSKNDFQSWFHDVATGPNANKSITVPITLEETLVGGKKHYRFDRPEFFPIDDGKVPNNSPTWGNGPPQEDGRNPHNFAFTTEAHFSFVYHGGEVFTFFGDDDLWLYINDKLAIDLGGLHPAKERVVNVDTLGLTKETRYPMDLFHAERHTNASRFTIDTTIECIVNGPVN